MAHTLIAVIPVYNHERPIVRVVDDLRALGLDVLLIDDGSEPLCARVLDALAEQPGVSLVRHHTNQGKGAAVTTGLLAASERGFSHALQLDADGQHDRSDIPAFISASHEAPNAVICGRPVYDASIPRIRLLARHLTHVWVWINTLSFEICDPMCGFRIYPLASTSALLRTTALGKRMDFDPEVLVRLKWEGVRTLWIPTHVHYPEDGLSHFQVVRDNARLSWMHARMFFGMLRRLPTLLGRTWRR